MPKRGETGTKELPEEMRISVRSHLESILVAKRWTHRKAAEELGIDIATLSKIRQLKGGIGVHLLLRLRDALQKPIDEILGLAPVGPPLPVRELVRATLDELAREGRASELPREDDERPLAERVPERKKSRGRQDPSQHRR